VLASGGNAFDAAIAVGATLSVIEPSSSGIGGGGFFLLHRARDGKDVFIDARETAPAESRGELWADAEGKIDRDKAMNGPLSAGIPGEPAAFTWMAEHYGKLPLKTSLAPAIRLAREGFPVYARFQSSIERRKEVLARWPGATRYGQWCAPASVCGRTISQTLSVSRQGWLLQGEFAARMVEAVRWRRIWKRETPPTRSGSASRSRSTMAS
jgi:gamma-glutamyltranspeptidase/glutathione hydrolase